MKKSDDFYSAVKRKIGRFLHFILRVHEHGTENEPQSGGLIVCANHNSFADVIVLGLSLKRPIRFIAKAELFRIPVLSQFIRAAGAIPIDRGGKDVDAIKKSVELLKNGESVGLFPQGHRYTGIAPDLSQVKFGVGLTAYRSGAAVLPVYIKSKKHKMHLLGRKDVIVGEVIENSELGIAAGNAAEYKRATELIFSRILELEERKADGN